MSTEDPQRASAGSGSGRSSGGRSRQNPQQQLSTIEKSVTHLLVATKQLLETLTMWSRGSATESEVSDVYVRLGYEFNIACRAFNAIGVDTSDLGPVPDLLRTILEDTLSQEASQASLDRYLPRIRDIIINLLHGLKKKQQRLRQKNAGGGGVSSASGDARPPRQVSSASTVSVESSLSRELEDVPSRHSSSRTFAQRQGSGEMGAGPDRPPRTTSQMANGGSGRLSPRRQPALSPQNSIHAAGGLARESSSASDLGSSISSAGLQNIPVIAPYPEEDTIPTTASLPVQQEPAVYEMSSDDQPPPRPPPKQNDALTALQRGGELERRASRRFSAYQIQKHLGGTAGTMHGLGALPPAQHSPAPNRGREVRESMSAVRSRASVHGRVRSRHDRGHEASPNRFGTQKRIDEEASETPVAMPSPPKPWTQQGGEGREDDSPMMKTPEDKLGHGPAYPFPTPEERQRSQDEDNTLGATLNGPIQDFLPASAEGADGETPTSPAKTVREHGVEDDVPLVRAPSSRRAQRYDTPPSSTYLPTDDSPPQPGKPLTLFLQYKSKIKKYVLDGGELSLARLQLAFIEKFAWNTQNNGADLPEIYIQDPVSGVRYELDGVGDVRDRSVLVLNVEQLDEVKRHIDDGIGGLRRVVEGIRTTVEEQQGVLRAVSERQQEAAREIAGMAAAPKPAAAAGIASTPPTRSSSNASRAASVSLKDRSSHLDEIRTLRRDLAVVRQTYTSFVSDINASMSTLKTKASSVKKAALDSTVPDISSAETGRAYLNQGKATLSSDSEKIVNRVDDLQDLVEDLRKDVVSRGVRPLPRQLEAVSKDISTATAELKKLQEFLKREKPVWTKIWEKELQVVCDDRDLLTIQEELVVDLEDDLEKAAGIFALVEQATKQQNLRAPNEGDVAEPGKRVPSRGALVPVALGGADPAKARDGVLGEVRALQPNHESRLEAIERAERARQRELESRKGGEFQRELGNFVEEGKLKKSGGVEEVERRRLAREEKTRREVHENMLAREREKEARKAAQAAQQGEGGGGGVAPQVNGEAGGGESNGNLEVPGGEEGRESSPEPSAFVEAKEGLTPEIGTPVEEKSES